MWISHFATPLINLISFKPNETSFTLESISNCISNSKPIIFARAKNLITLRKEICLFSQRQIELKIRSTSLNYLPWLSRGFIRKHLFNATISMYIDMRFIIAVYLGAEKSNAFWYYLWLSLPRVNARYGLLGKLLWSHREKRWNVKERRRMS